MCKIGKNTDKNPDSKYFGVAYGYKGDEEKIKNWAGRFSRWELMKKLDYMLETSFDTEIEKSPKQEDIQISEPL